MTVHSNWFKCEKSFIGACTTVNLPGLVAVPRVVHEIYKQFLESQINANMLQYMYVYTVHAESGMYCT